MTTTTILLADPLEALGWDDGFASAFEPHAQRGLRPGRVAVDLRKGYRLYTADGEVYAELAGKFRHAAGAASAYPAVGDWAALTRPEAPDQPQILALLPRRSQFVRRAAGPAREDQVVAANVDTVLLVTALDATFSLRRLERYLALAAESGARPVVVLSKVDLGADLAIRQAEIASIAPAVPVHAISTARGQGLELLAPYLGPGQTVALLGQSGVGKSTLTNALAGRAVARTAAVRARDQRGRHTTTQRSLLPLPTGGLIVDTPGLRQLQFPETVESELAAFADVQALAAACWFANCTHGSEPGCAVRQAVAAGTLPAPRLESYLRLSAARREQQARGPRRDEAPRDGPRTAPRSLRTRHRKR